MSAWRRRFLTPKSAWRRWHLVHVDVEFVAGSRRAALDVAEPPVAIQFLDGLAHLVRQDTMPGFVAQNGAQALHFDLDDALGRFGAATGRVDERYDGIFGRPPESLSAAGVEFGDRDGEGQSDVAFDGADLEPAAGSPVGAALDGVNFESADGRVSGFVVSAPGQRVPGADGHRED